MRATMHPRGTGWAYRVIVVPTTLALGVMTACTGPPASPETVRPEDRLVGEYVLVSADGHEVPTDVFHDGVTMGVVSGSMIFQPDRRCVSRMRFIPPGGAEMDREVAATYTLRGDTLTMQWEGAGTTIGVLDGDTFTMDNVGLILVYRKAGRPGGRDQIVKTTLDGG